MRRRAARQSERDPRPRDELRRHLRRRRRPDGELRSNAIASQGLLHARYGGVVPEIASRRHLEVLDAVTTDALERAGVTLDDIETVAVTRGPGLIGALLVGVSHAKAIAAARGCRSSPSTTCTGTSSRARSARTRSRRRTCASSPAAATRSSRAWTTLVITRSSGGRWTTPPARPSTRARACSGSAIRAAPRSTAWRAGDREAFEFPRSLPGRSRLQLRGLKTALLYTVRDLGEGQPSARADLAASYQRRSSPPWSPAALRRSAASASHVALGGGVAANSQLRAAAADSANSACACGCRRRRSAPTTPR